MRNYMIKGATEKLNLNDPDYGTPLDRGEVSFAIANYTIGMDKDMLATLIGEEKAKADVGEDVQRDYMKCYLEELDWDSYIPLTGEEIANKVIGHLGELKNHWPSHCDYIWPE